MTHDKIERSDVLNFFEYEKVRAAMRERVIELKRVRRVTVGEHLSFVFENRDTVLFQIQEMCRVERVTDDDEGPASPRPSRLTHKGRTGDDAPSGLGSFLVASDATRSASSPRRADRRSR